MKSYRPILKQHRRQRLVLWALTMLHWIAAMLAGCKVSPRHIAQRGDISLAWLTRLVTDLLFIHATHVGRLRRRGAPYWRHGRDLRRRHFRRSVLGAKLRRALRHKDLVTHIARLVDVLRNLDAYATQLFRNFRRRRRLWSTTPPIAPAETLLGAPAPPPAFSDSS
jgi:hypothetical protein